jgi:hypothetical protein
MDSPDSTKEFEALLHAVFGSNADADISMVSDPVGELRDHAFGIELRDDVHKVIADLQNIDPLNSHTYIPNEDLQIIHDNIEHFSDELLERIPNVFCRGESKLTYARESMVIIKAIAAGGGFSLRMLLHAGRVLIQPTHNCYGKNSTKNGTGPVCTKTRRLGCLTCASHKSTFMSPRAYMGSGLNPIQTHSP